MTEPKQKEFKTLLDEMREKKTKSPYMTRTEEHWARIGAKPTKQCPILNEERICNWSIKFRRLGPFGCTGLDYEERCSIYKKVMDAGGDPMVLIVE